MTREHWTKFVWADQPLASMCDSASSNKEILFNLGIQSVSQTKICIVEPFSVCARVCVFPAWVTVPSTQEGG